jgi:pimeloyl-ACP methyl ester carboxylesterase
MALNSRRTLLFASGALAVWAGVLTALLMRQDALTFPGARTLKAPSADMLEDSGAWALSVTGPDGQRIECFAIGDQDSGNRILAFPGNGGDALAYAIWFMAQLRMHAPDASFCVVAPHYRGYGATGGQLSGPGMEADAKTLALALQPRAIFGRSLGAGMAALAAVAFPAPTLVISPWESLIHVARDFARGFAPLRILKKFFRHEVKAGEAAVQATSAIRCLVFTRDSLVSNDRSRAFFLAWAGDKTWVELSGGHEDAINLSAADAGFLLGALANPALAARQVDDSRQTVKCRLRPPPIDRNDCETDFVQ